MATLFQSRKDGRYMIEKVVEGLELKKRLRTIILDVVDGVIGHLTMQDALDSLFDDKILVDEKWFKQYLLNRPHLNRRIPMPMSEIQDWLNKLDVWYNELEEKFGIKFSIEEITKHRMEEYRKKNKRTSR